MSAIAMKPELPMLRSARTPHSARVLGAILAVLLVMGAVGLVVVPWQQSVRGHGRVVAYAPIERQQTVAAPIDGRVVDIRVMEGSVVKAGDILLEMSDVDPLFAQRLDQERALAALRKGAAEARLAAVEGRVMALEDSRRNNVDGANARVQMAKERVRAAEQSLVSAQAALELAALNLPRIAQLEKQGLRSKRDLELADAEQKRAQADTERARATLDASREEERSLAAERARIEQDATASIQDARSQLEIARAEVANASAEEVRAETRVSRQSSQLVLAPRDGTVMRLLAEPGGPVLKQGAPLISLVPDTESRAIELWVDGNDAPLIEKGRKVRLQFEGWPALQFVGWPSVAVGTFGGTVALVDATDDGHGKFRILVLPDDEDAHAWPSGRFLRQGVRANGWVLLREVSVGFELWRQLNGFPPVVSVKEPSTGTVKGAK
jgi:membrane fusion protein, adhesin transport system